MVVGVTAAPFRLALLYASPVGSVSVMSALDVAACPVLPNKMV